MPASEDLINFDLIETQKENIQSLPSGRSAKALAAVFSPRSDPKSSSSELDETRNVNDAIRKEYELELESIDESDDPLDIYDRYVKWTLNAYPSAQATPQSGLLPLLERATNAFLSYNHYKSDPRYLRLWLHYIRLFSDSPRETFAFLARHGVGDGLALFYEEFAYWLENAGRFAQAEEMYKLGIEREARPAERLLRKFGEFQYRLEQRPSSANGPTSPALPAVRPALAAKFDPFESSTGRNLDPQAPNPPRGVGGGNVSRSGKPKMAIFSDADGGGAESSTGAGTEPKGWESIGSLKDRKKENTIEPTPWVGQTLKTGKKSSASQKMMVFRDESSLSQHNSESIQSVNSLQNEKEKVNPRTGKIERVFVNLDSIYPDGDDPTYEMSLEELRASSRGWMDKDWSKQRKAPLKEKPSNIACKESSVHNNKSQPDNPLPVELKEKLVIEDQVHPDQENVDAIGMSHGQKGARVKKLKLREIRGETQTIKTNLESPTGPKIKRKMSSEPTMTLHTKAATDEIYSIFNQPLKSELTDAENQESEYGSEYDDDDYTSAGESTATGRMSGVNSEFGDEETGIYEQTRDNRHEGFGDQTTGGVTGVSEWTEFNTDEHIPKLDLRMGAQSEQYDEDVNTSPRLSPSPQHLQSPYGCYHDNDKQFLSPTQLEQSEEDESGSRFVPIEPDDYNPPEGPYRDAYVAAQNRLPFMTPIVEQTESSLASAINRERGYLSTKTPCKMNRSLISAATPAIPEMDDLLWSSPFQEYTRGPDPGFEYPDYDGSPSKAAQRFKSSPRKLTAPKRSVVQTRVIIDEPQCNPIQPELRDRILANINPPLQAYQGYHTHGAQLGGNTTDIKKYFKSMGKVPKPNGTEKSPAVPPIICLSGASRSYAIKRELGEGGYAPVYLAESVDSPDTFSSDSEQENGPKGAGVIPWNRKPCRDIERRSLEAIKVEANPPSPWEFYMLRTAHGRLDYTPGYQRVKDSIVQAHEMHVFQDESVLVEDYLGQGTLLDLINLRAESSGGVAVTDLGLEEIVVMFFAVELFRTVEALHACGILHGDLKADNCLVRLQEPNITPSSTSSFSSSSLLDDDSDIHPEAGGAEYSPSGSYNWRNKGLTLIDFGRGIDMRVFNPSVQFIADWKVGSHECAEMRECRPWTYQVDLYGLAGTIYIMLFGKYMEVCPVTEHRNSGGGGVNSSPGLAAMGSGVGSRKKYRTKESLKRYWERDIWTEVFDVCLNPTSTKWTEIERQHGSFPSGNSSPVSESGSEDDDGPTLPVVNSMRLVREKMEAWLVANAGRKGLHNHLEKLEALVSRKRGKRGC